MDTLSVTIINQAGERSLVEFEAWAYRSLMELIVNELHEGIGQCGGKAWCGTCHVEAAGGALEEDMTGHERKTLSNLSATKTSRLSCQISLDEAIDGMTFTMLGE